jgi:hypothetical protein
MNDSFGFWHCVGFGGFTVVNLLVYSWVSSLAKPTYDETGDLLDGGADLNTHGNLSEYVHCLNEIAPPPGFLTLLGDHRYAFDVIYVIVFVQLTTIVSEYGWLVLLVVPDTPHPSSFLLLHSFTYGPFLPQIPAFAAYKLFGLLLGGGVRVSGSQRLGEGSLTYAFTLLPSWAVAEVPRWKKPRTRSARGRRWKGR